MNGQHRAIRALLSAMAPRRAIAYIKAFELPEVEEKLLIELDVRNRTYAQLISDGYSPEFIKRRRKSAYSKIADELNHSKKEARG